jgi:hypothetical protein
MPLTLENDIGLFINRAVAAYLHIPSLLGEGLLVLLGFCI